MNTDVGSLWNALSILGDHFSRLGGSARYRNMPESDIPLYIGCQLAAQWSPDFLKSHYIDPRFLEAGASVLGEVDEEIANIPAQTERLTKLLVELVTYADQRLKGGDRGVNWIRFVEWVRANTPNAMESDA
ncbi:MAG: hypothetical protein U5R46_11965 [Gammaproteobacteria bacterium]|nr:hypothetical protein [Gammaproteobacteria bacterium]